MCLTQSHPAEELGPELDTYLFSQFSFYTLPSLPQSFMLPELSEQGPLICFPTLTEIHDFDLIYNFDGEVT